MARLGKIARLPREVREQLNVRLDNGEVGRQLVDWLNNLPETQSVLATQFGGRPINEQNLTEWKQGGYEDWLRHQENCVQARMLVENAQALEKEAGEIRLEDHLAAPMAMGLARMLRDAEESPDEAGKQNRLLAVARELAHLRRGSHEAERVRLKREQWETAQAAATERKRSEAIVWPLYTAVLAKLCGRLFDAPLPLGQSGSLNPLGELPEQLRSCVEANARLLDAAALKEPPKTPAAPKQQPSESNQIKPNQTSEGAAL